MTLVFMLQIWLGRQTALKYEDGFYNMKPEFNSEHGSFIYKQKEHWGKFCNPTQLP